MSPFPGQHGQPAARFPTVLSRTTSTTTAAAAVHGLLVPACLEHLRNISTITKCQNIGIAKKVVE